MHGPLKNHNHMQLSNLTNPIRKQQNQTLKHPISNAKNHISSIQLLFCGATTTYNM